MKTKSLAFVLAAAAVSVALGGCARTAPLVNLNDVAVTPSNTKSLSPAQVRTAIIAAGTSLGWRIVDGASGKLEGTLNLREHTAVVDIPYSGRAYSIVYRSSTNLGESGGMIHSNYNSWVTNLDRAIRTEIARM